MKLKLLDITKSNEHKVLNLKVKDNQHKHIETVRQCLNDAKDTHYYHPVGLVFNDEIVGFSMYGRFPQKSGTYRVWLDRFLIDENFQNQGYGTLFFEYLTKFLKDKYNDWYIYLSVYKENLQAIKMYECFGFKFINEYDINGEVIMRLKVVNDN